MINFNQNKMYFVLSIAETYRQYFASLDDARKSAEKSSRTSNCDMIVCIKPDDDMPRINAVYSDGHLVFEV